MPATEQTWRDQRLLHVIFAVSGVLMLLSTVWMFYADHARGWKQTQRTYIDVETRVASWRNQAIAAETHQKHESLMSRLMSARSQPVAANLLADFQREAAEGAELRGKKAESQKIQTLGDHSRVRGERAAALRSLAVNIDEMVDLQYSRIETQQAQQAAAGGDAGGAADQQAIADRAAALATQANDLAARAAAEGSVFVEGDAQALQAISQTLQNAGQAAAEAAQAADAAGDAARQRTLQELQAAYARADEAALNAEASAAEGRDELLAEMRTIVSQARFEEDNLLRARKFKAADYDEARAVRDIYIRDDRTGDLPAAQAKIDRIKSELDQLTLDYQAASDHRKALQRIVQQITAEEDAVQKEIADNRAETERLQHAIAEQRSTYFVDTFPYLGKRWLELPILDAFNSPRKIENLWTEGLTIQYGSFSKVRRFDRCTTCHQAIDKTAPGSATDPAYKHEEELQLVMTTPSVDEARALRSAVDKSGQPLPFTTERVYGLELAERGLARRDEVAISFVRNESRAARAALLSGVAAGQKSGQAILEEMLHTQGWDEARSERPRPGLMLGDVITRVGGNLVRDRSDVERLLLQTVKWGEPVTLTVSRGLPHPYASHPRLDLFVGSLSPHPISGPNGFGCTICHEGQGSATDFKWASHTPNDPRQAGQWRDQHGWFYNHHWIFPMHPKRFQESTCLKCHHDVVELEPSEKFPQPPAPQVTKGHELIVTYGCFGCHEINGYDGPDRRIGPDLRMEPNFFAAAQQLLAQIPSRTDLLEQKAAAARPALQAETEGGLLAGADLENLGDLRQRLNAFDAELQQASRLGEPADASARQRLADVRALRPDLAAFVQSNERLRALGEMTRLADELVHHPERNATRRRLHLLITQDIELSQAKTQSPAAEAAELAEVVTALSADSHKLEPVLKDVEVPGTLRRAGPALRYVKSKDDEAFLLDWIKNPRHFRPETRMPKFFGLDEHLRTGDLVHAHDDTADPHSEGEAGKTALEIAHDFERIEVLGMTTYLLDRSQKFEFLARPEGLAQSTPDEKVARGRMLFETRGCLACHTHDAFPEATAFRHPGDMVQGPDLSGIGSKFDPARNPVGPDWLYSWIKEPARYHPRTKMPDLFLDPYEDGAGSLIDPADDIVAFLLSEKNEDWQPDVEEEFTLVGDNLPANSKAQQALRNLSLEFLGAIFSEAAAEKHYRQGIPESLRAEQKGFEVELISENGLTDRQRLVYVGAKSISKYGCYGCHDVPGFEDAKPIGTGLADWGRKDTSRLAFEHITHFLHQDQHGHHGGGSHEEETNAGDAGPREPLPPFYLEAIEAGHREGFIFQKLRQPRSYDYQKADNKSFNEWLRMPQFPFTNEEREQVITFVLGLIAEPPAEKFVYQPSERERAIQEGRRVLAKYNCGGCHTLEMEKWSLSFPPGEFRPPPPPDTFSFIVPDFTPSELAASRQTDRRGMLHATITGQPFVDNDGIPTAFDEEGDPVEADEDYDPNSLEFLIQLFEPVAIEGNTFMVGPAPFTVKGAHVDEHLPAHGGYLARYLVPRVIQLEREVNPAAKGSEAWGWVPPPLVGQGTKVQPEWLYNFLLNPYPIRPAVFLRMPKFNMSPAEAQALVNYFAAKDNANYPYEFVAPRQPGVLDAKDYHYAQQNQEASRLDDAMKIITNNAGCVKCHLVSDFVPSGSPRAKAPNLADVYRRMRPDYLRPWIGKPDSILPYTGMPVNINPQTGFATPGLYHGTPEEQLDGLVDLLMNFDTFTGRRTSISDLVQAANPTPAEGEEPATGEAPAAAAETSSSGSE
jgi:hypothetical protein